MFSFYIYFYIYNGMLVYIHVPVRLESSVCNEHTSTAAGVDKHHNPFYLRMSLRATLSSKCFESLSMHSNSSLNSECKFRASESGY